jgi:iron complex transport system ATP-binding protein
VNHLDFGNQIKVLRTIVQLARSGKAVILTTHAPDHAILLDAQAGMLDASGMLMTGTAEALITRENLMRMYEVDLHLAYITEVNRRVCVVRSIQ